MSHIVDLVLLKELWCEDPGGFWNDLIGPFAVVDALTPTPSEEDTM